MNYTKEEIDAVWEKGTVPAGNESTGFRKDACKAWISKNKYGDRNSKYGWEIDHINPNGSGRLDNLQPLHWENNVAKSDGKLTCNVTSSGTENVRISD